MFMCKLLIDTYLQDRVRETGWGRTRKKRASEDDRERERGRATGRGPGDQQRMGVKVHNTTQLPLTIKDRYLLNPYTDSGYYGAVEYRIRAGGNKTIPSSIFTAKMVEEKMTQQIHVTGGDNLLIMFHENFKNNKEIFLEMGDDRVLRRRFVPRGQITIRQRFWWLFDISESLPWKLIDLFI